MREEDLHRRNANIARSLHDMESMYKLQVCLPSRNHCTVL